MKHTRPSGKEIEIKDKVKDLGVITSADLKFREHINNVITLCKIEQGNILRNFATRKKKRAHDEAVQITILHRKVK